ncbi:MAG: phosphoglycerate mutase [Actinomycetia bacterium]|nr:phosphoglycerate mutase [Actinomycetes bacterium]
MSGILLIVLDGAGDRQQPQLGGMTPLESARTPGLDALAAAGSAGLLWPLGPGRAPTSPLAHFVLFGYPESAFPGRGCVEALGEGIEAGPGEVVCRVNFIGSEVRDGGAWVRERPDPRAGEPVNTDVDLDADIDGIALRFTHTGGAQGILTLSPSNAGPLCAAVTDADPMRPATFVRRVQPFAEAADQDAARRTADALNAWMLETRSRLSGRPLDMAVVKWAASSGSSLVRFSELTGLRGATLAAGALYRGLAHAIGLDVLGSEDTHDPAADLERDLGRAFELFDAGYTFVHVHTKWPDHAGHRKSPALKRDLIEALDSAVSAHLERLVRDDLVVCVTADHQTPASGPLYHSGGAVPLVICGGASGRDHVERFGERYCREGALGHLWGRDLMPLLLDTAERSAFLGAERYTRVACLGTPEGAAIRRLDVPQP